MISAALPSSSDPPEIDREINLVGEATGLVRGFRWSGKKIENKEEEVQILGASPERKDQVVGLELNAGTDSLVEDDGYVSVRKKGNDWLILSGDKVGRAQTPLRDAGEVLISASKYSVLSVDEVEEGEIAETLEVEEEGSMGVESTDILEGEFDENAWTGVVSMFGRARSLRNDQTLAQARSLRSDRAGRALHRDVATELRLNLGCYVATERRVCAVVTQRPSLVRLF
ncbi:hypothetical protein F2Q68_00013615 [Brassica cretica]|uniref:Uncharacterized protein n=1 Tax=Brassica cretica TaxID=69181 RepID=A0A8S9HN09_BRACR|nr:hypothetical protein F2Q68_00013615 [Brassica cretica]